MSDRSYNTGWFPSGGHHKRARRLAREEKYRAEMAALVAGLNELQIAALQAELQALADPAPSAEPVGKMPQGLWANVRDGWAAFWSWLVGE